MTEFVVTCGSTRYRNEMAILEATLTRSGYLVVAPTKVDLKDLENSWRSEEELKYLSQVLDEVYNYAIEKCDWVLVYGEHIGESVLREIAYANSLGKSVRFTTMVNAQRFGDWSDYFEI
jgi:hypothetical protein